MLFYHYFHEQNAFSPGQACSGFEKALKTALKQLWSSFSKRTAFFRIHLLQMPPTDLTWIHLIPQIAPDH